MSASETGESSRDETVELLDVHLWIEPPEECDCLQPDGRTSSVDQSLTVDGDEVWLCSMVYSDGNGAEYQRTPTCEACPCRQFVRFDCAVDLQEIRNGRLLYSVTVPDRSVLMSLIKHLRKAGASVSVTRIVAVDGEGEESPSLTDKQHETLLTAVELGYYDTPREADLADVAAELGVSRSAASQRLSSVRRRLVEDYVRRSDEHPIE
ncbi:MAG: helix-turn-helix domain-containing protein [Halobacteriales archaeon]